MKPNSEMKEVKIADTSSQDVRIERNHSTTKRWVILAASAATIAALFLVFAQFSFVNWISSELSVSGSVLQFATVKRGDLVRDVSVQGRVVAAAKPTVYSPDDGIITFSVVSGQNVQEGTKLALIESPDLANKLEQAKSLLSQRVVERDRQQIAARQLQLESEKENDLIRLALDAATREANRATAAYKKGGISEWDFEKAQDELARAETAHRHALANKTLNNEKLGFELRTKTLEVEQQEFVVAELQRRISDLEVRSPETGIVGNLLVDQKANVLKNQPIASVVNLSKFEVEAQVPESYADDLVLGLPCEIAINGRSYPAALVGISPEVISSQVTTTLKFVNDESPPGLRQNQRLTARVILDEVPSTLTVRRGPFIDSGLGSYVYVVEDGLAIKRSIQLGARSLNQVEILKGLNEGDQIVVSSTDMFEGAEKVLISN